MSQSQAMPDNTAVRVALWRALHALADAPPHVFEDTVGLQIANPDPDWRSRPDMSEFTRPFRASIVARARLVEDSLEEALQRGVDQYLILGAGLDSFAQRRPELAARMRIYEIDKPGPQAWKRERLTALGLAIPPYLHLVPVDFEAGENWRQQLAEAGFDAARPTLVAATGLSMYLRREAVRTTLQEVAALAPGSILIMSFLVPIELADPELRIGMERAAQGASASGTPFLSFFTPEEMLRLARELGFKDAQHLSSGALAERYFANRSDGLRPPEIAEELLIATT